MRGDVILQSRYGRKRSAAAANRNATIMLGELRSYVSLNVALTTDRYSAQQRFGFRWCGDL
jgi:hypothetical protein